MTKTVKIVQTRTDQLAPGDVCRPLEWETRRPVYKKVHSIKEYGHCGDILGVYWEPHSEADFPERYHLYDLFQLQVLDPDPVPVNPIPELADVR